MSGDKTPMTTDAAARIQSSEAQKGDGGVQSGDFAARAQAAADRNINQGQTEHQGGKN
ncbi:UNVERIFIED_CONTAM: hypothetical protein GTU68_015507 [Idotea baltica]|nr:hypothetical protein [Idotea baltica]